MKPTVVKEHAWLQQLVGTWTYETEVPSESGGEPHKMTGTEIIRAIGEIWIHFEGTGEMPDGDKATSIMSVGYDPDKKRFIGSWIGSMMTHMWVYNGELDADRKALTLNTEGPNFMTGTGTARYRDIITVIDKDNRTLTSQIQGEDGAWSQIMSMSYRRAK